MRTLLLILFCVPICVHAQTNQPAIIALVDKLPLVAKAEIFIDGLKNGKELHILSSKLNIAIAPRQTDLLAEHYFKLGKPLQEQEAASIEYRIVINRQIIHNWQSIGTVYQQKGNYAFTTKLIDTQLAIGDTVLLEFKKRYSTNIIQQLAVHRIAMLPKLLFYRSKQYKDSLDTKIAASLSNRFKRLKQAFDSLRGATIVVAAGHELQCLFKPVSVNKDSCLQYRLRCSGHNPNAWVRTGHLVSIPNLTPNQHYLLDIRYAGSNEQTTYTIQVMPYWYQTAQALLLFFIVLALLLWLFYRYQQHRQRQARKQLLEQLNQLQVKLNPHFVYNALGSIEGLAHQQEPAKLNHYLSAFSGILRSSLLNSQNLLIPLRQDMDLLVKYMVLEQLRYGFQYRLIIDENLKVDEIEFPPMLLQPMVENAIKHGVASLQGAGFIQIQYSKKDRHLLIEISDNGTGSSNNSGTGLGKQLTLERIDRLSRFLKQGRIECTIQHGQLGTVVNFFFENWLTD